VKPYGWNCNRNSLPISVRFPFIGLFFPKIVVENEKGMELMLKVGKETMKKMIATGAMCVVMTFSMQMAEAAVNDNNGFSDLISHWSAKAVSEAVVKGYVDGYPDGTFKPDMNISRAEFIKMAVTALRIKTGPATDSTWYGIYVDAAVDAGLVVRGEFDNMDSPMIRLELARLSVKSTGEVNTDFLKWMYLATDKGIIQGMDNQGTLGEDQPTTRAQAITVIERMLKLKAGEKLPSDKYATSAAEIAWHRTNVLTMAPEYFGYAKKYGSVFRWDRARFQSNQGYSEVEKYIVVDMGDPTDPNRKLIPDNMRWGMAVGNSRAEVQDVPINSYAFLSFNHFVRYNADSTAKTFRFALFNMLSFKLTTDDNVDSKGNLINIANYSPYIKDGESYYRAGGFMHVDAGVSEVNITTGQIAPKNPKFMKSENKTTIYRNSATDLGESGSSIIYDSSFTPSEGAK
jgi:hypothetical protein